MNDAEKHYRWTGYLLWFIAVVAGFNIAAIIIGFIYSFHGGNLP